MQRPQFAGQLRMAFASLGILRAQVGDGRGLQRLRNCAGIGRGAAAGLDLVVLGLRVERQRPRRGEPLIARRKLLVRDQRVLGADEIILRLVDRKRVLGVAKPFLQFLEPAGQICRCAPRGGSLRLLRFRRYALEIAFASIAAFAGSCDQTSTSTMKLRSVFFTLMWRFRASSAAVWPSLASPPERSRVRTGRAGTAGCPGTRRRTRDPCRDRCPGSPAAERCSR